MTQDTPVYRFAPSPNGELHLGHAFSALLNLKKARAANGRMLLRIEDIDTTRCTPALERQMLQDLEWIGFEWDETPRRQSEHFDEYRDALMKLESDALIYPSALSRREISQRVETFEKSGTPWPRDPDGAPFYPGEERKVPPAERPKISSTLGSRIIRLDMSMACATLSTPLTWHELGKGPNGETGTLTAKPENWGDVVLARRDTPTSYHLACTLDDASQGITHIVRGMDLFQATSIHRLLQAVLDLPAPEYFHHELVLKSDQRKLSKSKIDTSLKEMREAGYSKEQIRSAIGLDNS